MAPPAQLRRLLPGVVAACIGLVLAAGCGGGSSNQTSASPSSAAQQQSTAKAKFSTVDACSLVQASDASTAVGTQMAAMPGGGGAGQQSLCIYGPQDTSSGNSAGIFVMAVVYPDQATADAVSPEQVAAMFRVSGVTDAKVVSNIGDKAVEYQATTQSGSGLAIFVFRANVLVMISLEPGDSTKIEALARVAVSNLDKAPTS